MFDLDLDGDRVAERDDGECDCGRGIRAGDGEGERAGECGGEGGALRTLSECGVMVRESDPDCLPGDGSAVRELPA